MGVRARTAAEMEAFFERIRKDSDRRGELLHEAFKTGRPYRDLLVENGFPDPGPPMPVVTVYQCPTCHLLSREKPCPYSHDDRGGK